MDSCGILFLDRVDSTNRYVREHFSELPDGFLVAAFEQTAGRGRLHRKWLSPAGENVYATWTVKRLAEPVLATAAASLSVLDTLRTYAPEADFFLKWPNDVYSGQKKVCGILTEGATGTDNTLLGAAVGIGINVNSTEETLKDVPSAASLCSLTGERFSVKKVVSTLAKYLSACYIMYLNSPDALFARWKSENRLIGRELEFVDADGTVFRAVLRDIARSGEALLLRSGREEEFSCGDVRIVRSSIEP